MIDTTLDMIYATKGRVEKTEYEKMVRYMFDLSGGPWIDVSFSKDLPGADSLIEYLEKMKAKHDYTSTHDLDDLETRL